MKMRVICVFVLLCATTQLLAAQAQRALLVGVGSYRSNNLDQLYGPVNDVESLTKVLTKYWGFRASNIKTLTDREATRKNILRELDRIRTQSRAGDLALIYFSAHGTSVRDAKSSLPLPDCTGALLPWDFAREGSRKEQVASVIVGRRDLRPAFEAMDRDGVKVVTIYDSCFSGYMSRGFSSRCPARLRQWQGKSRFVALKSPGRSSGSDLPPAAVGSSGSCDNPYRDLVSLSASSIKEPAIDLSSGGVYDGRPHGAFTDSLLMVLDGKRDADADRDGKLTYRELFESVESHMQERGYNHQPKLLPLRREDDDGITERPVFAVHRSARVESPTSRPETQGVRLMVISERRTADGTVEELINEPSDTNPFRSIQKLMMVDSDPNLVLDHHSRGWTLWTSGCDRVKAVKTTSEAVDLVRQQLWIHRLLERVPKQQAAVHVDLHGVSNKTGQKEREYFEEGERVAIEVGLGETGYLLVINIASDGSLNVLYPWKKTEAAPFSGGQTTIETKVTAPSGIDYVVALALNKPPGWYSELVARNSSTGRIQPDTRLHKDLVALMLDEQVLGGWEIERLVIRAND